MLGFSVKEGISLTLTGCTGSGVGAYAGLGMQGGFSKLQNSNCSNDDRRSETASDDDDSLDLRIEVAGGKGVVAGTSVSKDSGGVSSGKFGVGGGKYMALMICESSRFNLSGR